MSVAPPSATPAPWPRLLVAAGVLATFAGLIAHGTWRALPIERFALSLALALIAWLLAWPLKRWLRVSWTTALVAVWSAALMVYAGPLQVLATAVLGLGALSIGLGFTPAALPARTALATTVGLIVIAGLTGWTITLPIHTGWLWAVALLISIAWQRHALLDAARTAMTGWNQAVATSPQAAMFCVMLLGLASTACWLPALQMDDLTYHLGLPTQLMQHARYAPAAEYQVWSFAPWAGDVLHGIVSALSRREAHGALNGLWLALAAVAAWSIASSLRASTAERWASLALFASLPPLVWIAAGMQTELAATAVTLTLMAVIVADAPGRLWVGAVLFAGLFALKLVHGMAALPLLLYAAWKHRPLRSWRRLAPATLLFGALALSGYAQSWLATGNPVLPIFNPAFQSPYFPTQQFNDPRWHAGFTPDLLWRITFDTDRHVEGWDGGYGFVLIALSGLWLLQLFRPGKRALMLAVTAVVLLPLMPMQYARYAFPGVAVLAVLLPIGGEAALGRRVLLRLVVGVCALNLAYQANASWLHHSAALKRTIRSPFDDTATLQAYLPERLLLRRLPEGDTGLVLATDPERGFIAELGGRGRTVSTHDPSLAAAALRAKGDASGTAWAELFARERIAWVLLNADTASPALRAGLARAGAKREAALDSIELWRRPAATGEVSP
ncbi:MAG: hypothetical protein J0M09_10645 [Xanthomonadales bacterium]|nr:hypothetical protein [Xanthomonadales bacterium]